jgi:peptidoglycan-N-acetylglucosamine deacetylase
MHSQYTNDLLDELTLRKVNLTFFVIGINACNNPDIVKRAFNLGHQIGIHTWNHPDLVNLSDEGILGEVSNNNSIDTSTMVIET